MAYGFGTTVNPQLGAVDYSNYLRGALSGAQMQAQGGAAIGAGVQNALAGIGEGIEKFQQNQQEIATMVGDVKGMTQANPYLLESLDPKQMKVLESIRDGDSVKKKDMLEVYGAISAKNKMAQQQAEAQSRAVQDALNRAQQGLVETQTRIMGMPKAPEGMRYTQEELNEVKELGYDYEIISRNSDGSVQVSGVSPFAPEQSTMTDTERTVQARLKAIADSGQTVTPEIEADIRAQVRARGSMAGDPEQKARLDLISQELPVFAERAAAARDLLPGVVNIAQKLNTGLETGKMAPVVTFINGWANALGIPVDTEALADKEAGAAIFNQFMLEFLQKTKGSISERENALFQSMGPQFYKSIKANKELVALVAGRLNNDVNLGRIYQKGLAQQKPLSEILSEIETKGTEYEQKFLDELEDLAQSVIPIAPSRKPEISNFEAPSKYSPGEEVSVGSDLGNGFKLIN